MEKVKKYFTSFDKWDLGLLIVCLGFYLFFPFYDGPVWCKDSPSYAAMNITREPLYPSFLKLFRSIFGENGYLMPVVLVQSVLAAYASWKLAVTIKRYRNNSNILAVLSVCFQFGVTFLCRFVAVRGSSYINSIMTEGIGLSLYVLFVIQLYKYILEERKANLAGTVCFAVLLINLRKQMMITACLMAAVFLLYYLIKKRQIKRLLFLLILTAALIPVCKLTDRIYNYAVRSAWIEHSGNSMGLLCTLIYTSGEDDIALFEDSVLRDMYTEILIEADKQGLRMEYAPDGWVDLSSHYADSYDAIGYGIINPVVQGYIAEEFGYGEVEAALKYDEYCGSMSKVLLAQEKGDLIKVYAANTWKGFVNSIARVNSLLNIYAVLVYAVFLLLYVFLAGKYKRWGKADSTVTFAEIVLGGVIINSMVVGAMIFCQPRYMIYNMGLFYSALSMLVYDVFAMRKKDDKKIMP